MNSIAVRSLGDLSVRDLTQDLRRGLRLRIGPFVILLEGRERALAERLQRHYPNYPLAERFEFADVRLAVGRNPTLSRHWFSNRVIRTDDGQVFTTFPREATLAHIEWTLNWAIANRSHQYLMLHAGVLANEQGALLLPAHPGAGKSTLCAYLMHRGWRLLSDEFTLIPDRSLQIQPFPRLIPLKNQSIDVIRELVPEAHLGPAIPGTHKGTVSHLRPSDAHIQAMDQTATPRLMIFPTYKAGSKLMITRAERSECFVEITQNAFNYVLRGQTGFELSAALTNQVVPYRLTYSDLPSAARAIDELMLEATATVIAPRQ